MSDAQTLANIGNYRVLWQFMTDRFPSPYTLSDAESFLTGGFARDEHPAEYPRIVAVFLKNDQGEEGELIGTMGMRPGADINYREWDLGYFLTPSQWGKGYATEAVGALVKWCFETWPGLVRIQASTYEFNDQSGRVLTKTGFQREGLRRASAEKDGKIVGEIFYGILRSDLEKN